MILVLVWILCRPGGLVLASPEVFTQAKIDGIISQAPGSHSIQMVPDPLNPRNRVVRFEVRPGDVWRDDAQRGMFGVERAELSEPEYRAPFRMDQWYRFRVLIPKNSTDLVTRCLVAQWHGTPDQNLGEVLRSPVLGIEMRGKEFIIRKCHSNIRVQLNNSRTNNKKRLYRSSEFAERNVWHDIVVNVKWSWENDGYCHVWIDGHQVVDYTGPIGYNDVRGPYFKSGIYRDSVPEAHIVYFDGYRRGADAADIDFME